MSRKRNKRNHGSAPFDPKIDTGTTRPVTARIAVRDANDKYSEYPSNGLNPFKLARIFREADEGNVMAQMELFEEMEEKDAHVFSQLQTRKLAVTGLDWEVQPFSESDQDKEIAAFINKQLKGIDNFNGILTDMLDAIGKGISIMEIDWDYKDGENIIQNIEYVHPKKLIWDGITDEMKICTREYPSGVELPENKFVVHRYKAKSGHPSRAGVLRVVAWMYLFKNYDVKDWVSFCEVYGMPLRLGKYDVSASEDDKKQLMEAILSLGTDAAGIVPNSTMIEFIESNKTTSAEIYEGLARYCDEQISKAILGQTLTSDSGGGSYAQGKVHNDVRHDLTVADVNALECTIRRDIIRPLVEFNYGTGTDIPLFCFDCKEEEDQKEKAEIYKMLACDMGLEIPVSHIYKTFNIPKPEDGEKVLRPPQSGMQQPPSGEEIGELKLKQNEGKSEQNHVDQMVGAANKQAEHIFMEMMKPVFNIIDKAGDLEELQAVLKDEKKLRELYQKMEVPELDDLIQQGIYLSHLIGRTMS